MSVKVDIDPNKKYYWEDFVPGSVWEFGNTKVLKEDILEFARKYDPQPIHIDEEYAKKSIFGDIIASGWHTAALAMRMMCDAILSQGTGSGSPGMENLLWIKPVRVGDVLRCRYTVLEARPLSSKPHLGMVRHLWEVLNQNDEVVLSMQGSAFFLRRP